MEAVHAFLYQQSGELGDEVSIEVFPPSARLPECRFPQPFFPGNGQPQWGRIAVGVRCGEQGEQVRYMQAQIKVIGRYLVAARALDAGTRITADMLEFRQGDLSRLPRQAILDPGEVIGQQARRPLAAGTTIQRHQLREPPLIERGQQVVLEAAGPGYRITREGKAMAPGAMGDRIRVRVSRHTILSGVVVGQARVAVAAP
ncbi:flagellar basal body P-ring formation chaperone FlgA [Zobellella maritima]|uniref:flagellar basal body P-ring formation chaperone FlgA n=1 Tax=Zobellella maritima TaxID=2059725 RepID=UPI001E4FCF9D|nr:flagellar basal body P-ring formation chaperone FlgA [Zobellella maritima]